MSFFQSAGFFLLTLLLLGAAPAVNAEDPVPVIFDTDFVMPPADDGMALMLARSRL